MNRLCVHVRHAGRTVSTTPRLELVTDAPFIHHASSLRTTGKINLGEVENPPRVRGRRQRVQSDLSGLDIQGDRRVECGEVETRWERRAGQLTLLDWALVFVRLLVARY